MSLVPTAEGLLLSCLTAGLLDWLSETGFKSSSFILLLNVLLTLEVPLSCVTVAPTGLLKCLFGARSGWLNSGQLSATTSSSTSTLGPLEFLLDVAFSGSTCHLLFKLLAAFPTLLPVYLPLRFARGRCRVRGFLVFCFTFGCELLVEGRSRRNPLDAFGADFSVMPTQCCRHFLTSSSLLASSTI